MIEPITPFDKLRAKPFDRLMARPVAKIRQRIVEFFSPSYNGFSRTLRSTFGAWSFRSTLRQPTKDWGRSDYPFWRRAYRAQAVGLELSGLFIKVLCSKISAWSLGRPPQWRCESEATQEALDTWMTSNHADLLQAYKGSLKQGDAFLVINSDLTITLLAPDCVWPIVAEDDYSLIVGWRVTQTLPHPERSGDKMIVTDEYYIDRRVHRVEKNGQATIEINYPNLLGRLTIVHIPNAAEDGESFGHAEAEALLEVMHRYGEIFDAAIAGNKRQGRPTPVLAFEARADLDQFWVDNGTTARQTLPDGSIESFRSLNVDLSQLLTVSGADFKYASPGSFTGDTAQLLELMFYLILQHSELPEFVMGNAISSSKASAETQMPVFERFIEGKRGELRRWLLNVAEIVVGYLALTTPGVGVEPPTLQWQKLTNDGRLTLDAITWAYAEGLLDERTALMLAPIEVTDIESVLAQARKEREERQQQAQDQMAAQTDAEIARLEAERVGNDAAI